VKKIHFIGIGGIGLSAFGKFLSKDGIKFQVVDCSKGRGWKIYQCGFWGGGNFSKAKINQVPPKT